MCELFGYTLEELKGENCDILVSKNISSQLALATKYIINVRDKNGKLFQTTCQYREINFTIDEIPIKQFIIVFTTPATEDSTEFAGLIPCETNGVELDAHVFDELATYIEIHGKKILL